MRNAEVAAVFYEIADILELQGVPFKPQAYRRAAAAIEQLDGEIARAVETGSHKDIPGVGNAIAAKIEELVETGRLDYLDRLRAEVPEGLLEIMAIPDVGPKTAMLLHRELGISSVDELKEAAEAGRISALKGFGEKTQQRLLRGIKTLESKGRRSLLGEAAPVAQAYLEYLRGCVSADMMDVCGSLRRGKETIGDLDILVASRDPEDVANAFTGYQRVEEVIAKGATKSSVRLAGGFQVDLRVVDPDSCGAALQYFTGSKEHNVVIRKIGVEIGLKVNEYGVFDRTTDEKLAGANEEGVYAALGLPWIPPELREDQGEVDAAREGRLPDLVDASDIRGDLHIHTEWSDGSEAIGDIIAAAHSRDYDYIAITDHTQSLAIANGLSPDDLRRQIDAVRREEERQGGAVRVFAGTEVDILGDGSLDLPSAVLEDLDLVVASVHSRMKMSQREMTDRVITAIESGLVDVIGHPTGRIIGRREALQLDLERVFDAAAENDVAMEINCFPDRLDLRDVHCRLAKGRGVSMAIGTDSHSIRHLDYIGFGIVTARRGWLEKDDVLNSLGAKELEQRLQRRRT